MAASTSEHKQREFDVAIVGAGIVGSALAYGLGRSGRKVALFERDMTEPDRIVGELLQPGGVRALYKLDLIDCLRDIDAVPVEGYHVFYGPKSVPIPYPQEQSDGRWGKGIEGKSGKVEGRSFHHGRFVQKLRNAAIAQPNVTILESTVRELIEDKQGNNVGVIATAKDTKRKQTNQNKRKKKRLPRACAQVRARARVHVRAHACACVCVYLNLVIPSTNSCFVNSPMVFAPNFHAITRVIASSASTPKSLTNWVMPSYKRQSNVSTITEGQCRRKEQG